MLVCGNSASSRALQEELRRIEAELQEEWKKIQEKDAQIESVRQCLEEQMAGSEEAADAASVRELRAELKARRKEHRRELEAQREALEREHQTELAALMQDRDAAVQSVCGEGSPKAQDAKARRAAAERAHEVCMERLRDMARAEVNRYRSEADAAERELQAIRDQVGPLRAEHTEAAEALQHARFLLRAEMLERNGSTKAQELERNLAQAQEEHLRVEQRYTDISQHLRVQNRDLQSELRARTEELWQRNDLVQRRDAELVDVNQQLAELQALFDDVNGQLSGECRRIEQLQENVTTWAKQKQEIDHLEVMLQDSHTMIRQVRDALEEERRERQKAALKLEEEQQRTALLLQVLKHFKEQVHGLQWQAPMVPTLLTQPLSPTFHKAPINYSATASTRPPSPSPLKSSMLSPPRLLSPAEVKQVKEVPLTARPVTTVHRTEPIAA